jgi:anthranilate phosphoribosyltransferase
MIKSMLEKVIGSDSLSLEEAKDVMNEIMEGNVNPSLLSGLLVALKSKGESAEEIAGFALAMRDKSIKLKNSIDNTIDVCGTGGDNSSTFNISTAVAFVVAGSGVRVAKHGNKSISSKCGSADVLKELGVNINLPVEQSAEALEKVGITFLFAPQYHPAMKHAAQVRKELGMKTIFNMLGPLTNPAGVKKQLIGTYNDNAMNLMAKAAQHLDYEKVHFLCAGNKYDEIILDQEIKTIEVNGSMLVENELSADTFDYPKVTANDIKGGDVKENAQIILDALTHNYENKYFYTICANGALALHSAGVAKDLVECKNIAEESVKSGAAYEKLAALIEFGKSSKPKY